MVELSFSYKNMFLLLILILITFLYLSDLFTKSDTHTTAEAIITKAFGNSTSHTFLEMGENYSLLLAAFTSTTVTSTFAALPVSSKHIWNYFFILFLSILFFRSLIRGLLVLFLNQVVLHAFWAISSWAGQSINHFWIL